MALARWLVLLAALLAPAAHAALTLQGVGKPARVTVATTWGTVTLPSGTEYIVLRPETITGYFGVGCADGAALGSHYLTITADTTVTIAVDRYGTSDVCLAGSGAGTIQVYPTGRGR
jgi:hypothetical protein